MAGPTATTSDYAGKLFIQEVGKGNSAPPEWLREIEPTFLSYEAVPLLNFPFFNEVQGYHFKALCHAMSKLLLMCHCIAPTMFNLHCHWFHMLC